MATSSDSVKARTARGMRWTSATQLVGFVLQLAYSASIGRILAPHAFGVFALANVLLRFVTYVARLGVAPAVVQAPELSTSDIRKAHTVSVALGVALTAVTVAIAPLSSLYTNDPQVGHVIQGLAFDFTISSFSFVPGAVLRRALAFRQVGVAEASSYFAGYLVVGLGGAWLGFGVWSLVAAGLTQGAVRAALLVWFSRVSPIPVRSVRGIRRLLGFGTQVSVIGFLEFWGSNLDTASAGHVLVSSSLGQYNRASTLVWLPVQQVGNVVSGVMTSAFARASRAGAARAYTSAQTLMAAALIPFSVYCVIWARPLTLTVLGPTWTEAATVAGLLSVAAALNMLSQIPAVLCEALAILRPKLANQVVSISVFAVGIVFAYHVRTLDSFAVAWLCAEVSRHIGYLWILAKHRILRMAASLTLYLETIVMCLPMTAGMVALRFLLSPDTLEWVQLLASAGIFAGSFLLTLRSSARWPVVRVLSAEAPRLAKLLSPRSGIGQHRAMRVER